MTPEKIVENHKKYVLQSWSKQGNLNPIPVAKAEGIYFYDFDGNKYTDMSSQLVNLNLGYGNKAIGDAIKEQVDKFCFVGPSYATEAKSTLAEMIINLLPDSFGKVFFTNAGADANENAVKIARMFTAETRCSAVTEVITVLHSAQATLRASREDIRLSRVFRDL